MWVRKKAGFLAEELYNAVIKSNSNELVRLIVTHLETDMEEIKRAFEVMYGQSLEDFIVVSVFDFLEVYYF